LCLILGVAYFFYGIQPSYADEGTSTTFTIEAGESFRGIGARLSQEGLVRSISMFKVYAFLTGRAQKFQPGVYTLSSGMSVSEIVSTITTVGSNEATVTIPEGATIRDIDALLFRAGVLAEAGAVLRYDFTKLFGIYPFLTPETKSLEGYLFPDTYRFHLGADAARVVARFLDTFQEKAWPLLEGRERMIEDLILASYLEREVPGFDDRRIVAGVLLKRLRIGMPFQIDAAIIYIRCNGAFLVCEDATLRRSDFSLASPYNTYQRVGWTPTPIANPGAVAIKAAITPETTPYLYYLSAKDTKETIFSRTLEEHNNNRVKYL